MVGGQGRGEMEGAYRVAQDGVPLEGLLLAEGVEADGIVVRVAVELDHDGETLAIFEGDDLVGGEQSVSGPDGVGNAYVDLLRLHKAGVVGHYPHLVRVNRHSPRVFQATVDEVHHHPAPVLRFDDLLTVSILSSTPIGARTAYLVVRVGRDTLPIADGPRGL